LYGNGVTVAADDARVVMMRDLTGKWGEAPRGGRLRSTRMQANTCGYDFIIYRLFCCPERNYRIVI